MTFGVLTSTQPEGKFPIQRVSQIVHLLRFHVNMHLGCGVMAIFVLLPFRKRLKCIFFPTLIWKDRMYRQQQNKLEPHDYLSTFPIFVHVWVRLYVWETHVYDPSPQAGFILDSMLVNVTITPKFSHITLLHHNQPIEKIHPFFSSP